MRAVVEEQELHVGGQIITRQRIEYVYCGPADLLGQTFKDISVGPDFGGMRRGATFPVHPPLEVDETGIWLLVPWQDTWFREGRHLLGTTWPARPNVAAPHGPDYEGARKLAEAMETIWLAKSEEERLEWLKVFVLNPDPEVAIGAIRLLDEIVPHEFELVVRHANVTELALRTQIAIDERMTLRQPHAWRDGEVRKKLLASWRVKLLNGDDAEALIILQQLSRSIQMGMLDQADLFEMIESTIKGDLRLGEPHSIEVRVSSISVLLTLINDATVHDNTVQLLITLLNDDEPDQIKLLSVNVLRLVTALKPGQMRDIETIRNRMIALAADAKDPRASVSRIAARLIGITETVPVEER